MVKAKEKLYAQYAVSLLTHLLTHLGTKVRTHDGSYVYAMEKGLFSWGIPKKDEFVIRQKDSGHRFLTWDCKEKETEAVFGDKLFA